MIILAALLLVLLFAATAGTPCGWLALTASVALVALAIQRRRRRFGPA